MQLIDKIINKVGNDKVLHFLAGSVICSLVSFVVILQEVSIGFHEALFVFAGMIAAGFAAVIKEMADESFEVKDIVATLLGTVPTFIAVLLGILFSTLSN